MLQLEHEKQQQVVVARIAPLWLSLSAFLLTVVAVNPLRETAMEDDWAYAWTVQHWLATGRYQLNDWLSANMPFQAAWGALFSLVGGYSFSTLRISTLVLMCLGLIAFYFLAQEHDMSPSVAGLLTLGLWSSPLVVRFSFNFMTDVPFLACLTIALLGYTRAIRQNDIQLMFLASLVGAAAILVRQFGLALVVGLVGIWLLDRERWRKVSFFIVGVVLPLVAAITQVLLGSLRPNFAARVNIGRQTVFVSDAGHFVWSLLWRLAMGAEYLAGFVLPFVLLAGVMVVRELGQRNSIMRRSILAPDSPLWLALLLLYGCIATFVTYLTDYPWLVKFVPEPWLFPTLPWNFSDFFRLGITIRFATTILLLVSGTVLARIILMRYAPVAQWLQLSLHQRLLDLVMASLFALQWLYVDFGDEYLLSFLPYVLILLGRYLGPQILRWRLAAIAGCAIMLCVSAMWTRSLLSREVSLWEEAELLKASGVPITSIGGSWTWQSYYRFPDYVASMGDQRPENFNDYFRRWMPEQAKAFSYLIVAAVDQQCGEPWQVVKTHEYRNIFFQTEQILVCKRTDLAA